jgi:hypothetical protein
MGILDTVTKTNEYGQHGIHIFRNFFTEEELALLDTWVETSYSSSTDVSGHLTAKNYSIITNRESVRPYFTKLREAIKTKCSTETLFIARVKVLEISPWEWEELVDPDYVPTEEQLASWDRPMKTLSYNLTEVREAALASVPSNGYALADFESGIVSNPLFLDIYQNPIEIDAYHAMVVLNPEFTGGSVTVNSSITNEDVVLDLNPGDVLFFNKSVSGVQQISKVLTGKRRCFNLVLTEDRAFRV